MARYSCSRMTVNKALSELAQADLIERRRRAGTFVRRPQHLSAVLKIATADFAIEPPGSWLLHHVPWTEAEHTISAIVADDRTAAALDIAVGAPCLVIERHTWRSARTLTAVRLLYPGDSHRLVARFKGG